MLTNLAKKNLLIVTFAFAVFSAVQSVPFTKRIQSNAPGWDPHLTPFPPVRRGDVVFEYRSEAAKGNVSVPDPYNWFENSDAAGFLKLQLAFTKSYLDKLEDLEVIRTAIKDASNYAPLYAPTIFGPDKNPTYLYYFKDVGAKYWRSYTATQKELDEAAGNIYATLPGKVLIDESLLGGKIANSQQISPDGTKLLYSVADQDTYENAEIFVRDVSNPLSDKTQKVQEGGYGHYPDVITDIKGGYEIWSGDSKSFFYVTSDGSIRYHVLGTDVKGDPVILKPNKDTKIDRWPELSDDLRYLFVFEETDTLKGRRVYVASLDQQVSGPIKWVPISTDDIIFWDYVTSVEDNFYFETTKGAPNHQIVRFTIDFSKAVQTDDLSTFIHGAESVTVIPQRPDAKIAYFGSYDNDKVLIVYNKDDTVEVIAFSLKTGARLQQLSLDTLSTSVTIQTYASSPEVYLQVYSLNSPSTFYHLSWDHVSNKFSSQLAFQQKSKVIDPEKYVVEFKHAPSKTGNVKVPFYILYRKGLKFDGTHPVIINFYGAYGWSLTTWYDSHHYAFVREYDAIYIVAAPRGGGESGEDWHKAGQLKDKQNTFDDVIAIAQYAIDQKWTSPGKVIINVQSSGASAAAAIINQAPEGLFGVFIGTRGAYDWLRLDQSSDKAVRIAEYGSPSDPKAFDWLLKYSPLHNINPKKAYPTILIYPSDEGGYTAEPWHSYKYISELQYDLPNNPSPLLLGNGKDTQEERSATAFALAAHVLGLKRVI